MFLILPILFSISITAQEKTFQEKLQLLDISYNTKSEYTVLSDTTCYIFEDDKCPMRNKLGIMEALLLSKDKECLIGVYFPPFYNFHPKIVKKTKSNRYSSHDRIAHDFSWGKKLRSASKQDLNDIESLMKHYTNETSNDFFNADYMFSYPLNFQGETCDEKYRYGRALLFGKESVINIILYFVTTEKGVESIDNYIDDSKRLFIFENVE